MPPKLYMVNPSPPVRAVLMVAKDIGLNLELKEVNLLASEHLKPEFLKINPTHTVPALDDDGFTLWDSHAILAYLIQKYAKNDSLYPKDVKTNAIINQLLHFDTGTLFARMVRITRPIFLSGKKVVDQADKDAVIESYGFLEAILNEKVWAAGGKSCTVADYSLAATISSLDVIVPVDSQKFPNITTWWKKCQGLPGYSAGMEGLAVFTTFFKSSLN